jgi:hypothetical protein
MIGGIPDPLPTMATTCLTLVDGFCNVVPDSLELTTPYVLSEQQDWFEDEIRFLRRLLQPGMNAIDIGANYGVYTLAMAQVVGATALTRSCSSAAPCRASTAPCSMAKSPMARGRPWRW